MASAFLTELFTGGVCNLKHPALLKEGELQRGDDCVYRDKDEAVWRAPGRTSMLTTALGGGIDGIGHFAFNSGYTDQFVLLGRSTAGNPTWTPAPDPAYPANHLYGCDFTAVSGLTLTEIGGQGYWYVTMTGATPSIDGQITIASVVITGSTLTMADTTGLVSGMVVAFVSGTGGISASTTILSVDSATSVTLNQAGTNGTATLTFTQYPFLASAVGARIIGAGVGTNCYIISVSNQDGTTGHYRTATLSRRFTVPAVSGDTNSPDGLYPVIVSWGSVYNLNNTGAEQFDYIQYGARKYYFWDGIGTLQVAEWKTTATALTPTGLPVLSLRPVALKPVENAPTITKQTGQSTGWSTVKGAGTYWILVTEIFSPEADIATALKDPVKKTQIVESAYLATNTSATADTGSQSGIGLPISVTIATVASENVLVTFPKVTNDGKDGFIATHWGIYIYGPTTDMPSLAQLRRCATPPITKFDGTQTYVLTDSILSQTQFPGNIRAAAGRPSFGHSDYLIGGFDGKDAYTKVGGSNKSIPDNAAQGLISYPFSVTGAYAGKSVVGIELQVRGRCNPSGDTTHAARYWVRAMISGGGKSTDTILGEFGGQDNHINYHGGPMDTLGVAWSLNDTPNIEIEIGISNRGHKDELDIDTVGVKVYYATGNVDFNGPAYRVVTYRDQIGLTVSDPARLRPPNCSTGDFFNGSLVLNNLDTAFENQLRYSLPGDPEAWPKPYELTFNTRKRDRVRYIKTLGTILFVGMENSLKRVNYLPTEQNTDLNSGLAHEDIATDHGIPGPFCAVKIDMPGEGSLIAYASQVGPYISNGIWTRPLNTDLDWPNTVKVSALSTAVMRVYPKEKWIAFYFCPAGATHSRNTRVMYFCYQSDKLKQGQFGPELPMIGPCVVSARAAGEAWLNNTPYLMTANEADGMVYLEDSGLTIPSGYQVTLTATASTQGDGKAAAGTDVSINPLVRTRRLYPAGVTKWSFGEDLYTLYSSFGTSFNVSSCVLTPGNTTITSTAGFANVLPGMTVSGVGIDGGTIVLSKSDSSHIVVNRAPNGDGATTTLTFDTGTIGITIRANTVSVGMSGRQTVYGSTLTGELDATQAPEIAGGFELQFEKVPLTFDSNHDTLTWADLGVNMRLHQFTYVLKDAGEDMNRIT